MRIDVWSDVVCPWCYLGKARLEKVVAASPRAGEIEVVFRSFELDPRTPKDLDVPTDAMLAKKYGMGRAQIDAIHERLRAMGRAEGIDFHFDRTRTSNTFEAHELIKLASEHDRQKAMVDRLFRAQFEEGVRVGDREALVRVATELGLDPGEVRGALDSERFAAEVRADENEARELGISGVPFFAFGGSIGVSGAQPGEVLRAALDEALGR